MAKKKPNDSSRKPYVENYPPLKEWLEKHGAACQTQHMTDGYSLETWAIGYVIVVILVRANNYGWDIFTPCHSLDVDETLADADARIARPGTAAPSIALIASAAADAWVGMQRAGAMAGRSAPRDAVSPNLLDTLDALESATRNSPFRKMKS